MKAPRSADAGFTLIEMLVSMVLFAVLGTVLLSFALGSSQVADGVRADSNVTGEARVAIERMARELRQAEDISHVDIVDGQVRQFTLQIDFDGQAADFSSPSAAASAGAYDAEVLTYTWNPGAGTLTMSDGGTTADVLSAGVVSVVLDLRSSDWTRDLDGDGTTTWQEIDQPVGQPGHDQLDEDELDLIDLVAIEIEVADGDTSRMFVVQADMRNQEGVQS